VSEVTQTSPQSKTAPRPVPEGTADPAARPPAPRLAADRAIGVPADDSLEFKTYAEALAAIIDDEGTDTPLTIAISAPWGAGKTSLANLVIERLRHLRVTQRKPKHIVCWFNAWMHQDAEHPGAALAGDVARSVNRGRRRWRRIVSPLPSALLSPYERWRRRIYLALAVVAVVALPAALDGVREFYASSVSSDHENLAAQLGSIGSVALVTFGALSVWGWLFAAAGKAAHFVDEPASEAALGSMQEVRAQLGGLISQATRGERRLVICIDDLERCEPDQALGVCHVASQLLGHEDVVTLLLADMSIVAEAAPGKSLYLQKLIQLQFQLPPPNVNLLRQMVTRITGEKLITEGLFWALVERVSTTFRAGEGKGIVTAVTGVIPVMSGIFYLWSRNDSSSSNDENTSWSWWDWLLVLGVPGVVLVGLGTWLLVHVVRSLRRRRLIAKIDAALREELSNRSITISELVDAVGERFNDKHDELIRQRAQRLFTDESALLQEAESAYLAFLTVPRSVKRAINHLRILLVIADGREMLGGSPTLNRSHLWKWVVLGERWPDLASELASEPNKAMDLEEAKTAQDIERTLSQWELSTASSDSLLEFIRADPAFGDVARRLVYFERAPITN
jgi:hypothetical protein